MDTIYFEYTYINTTRISAESTRIENIGLITANISRFIVRAFKIWPLDSSVNEYNTKNKVTQSTKININ